MLKNWWAEVFHKKVTNISWMEKNNKHFHLHCYWNVLFKELKNVQFIHVKMQLLLYLPQKVPKSRNSVIIFTKHVEIHKVRPSWSLNSVGTSIISSIFEQENLSPERFSVMNFWFPHIANVTRCGQAFRSIIQWCFSRGEWTGLRRRCSWHLLWPF